MDLEDDSHLLDLGGDKLTQVRKRWKNDLIFASGFSIWVISNYLMADLNNKKNANSYKIGIFTITMVITFVMIIWSTLTYSNRIFLKLAQNSAGESDF